jgi:hypothetical protein
MKYLLIAAALASLGACTSTRTNNVPQYVTVEVYPNLPDIELKKLKLENIEFDVHREQTPFEHRIADTKECQGVSPLKRDMNFWTKCLTKAPQAASNLYVGVDQRNFNKLMSNAATTAEREAYIQKFIINPENERRKKWREYNKAIREKK